MTVTGAGCRAHIRRVARDPRAELVVARRPDRPAEPEGRVVADRAHLDGVPVAVLAELLEVDRVTRLVRQHRSGERHRLAGGGGARARPERQHVTDALEEGRGPAPRGVAERHRRDVVDGVRGQRRPRERVAPVRSGRRRPPAPGSGPGAAVLPHSWTTVLGSGVVVPGMSRTPEIVTVLALVGDRLRGVDREVRHLGLLHGDRNRIRGAGECCGCRRGTRRGRRDRRGAATGTRSSSSSSRP